MDFKKLTEGLTEEQIEKAKAATTPEELLAIANETGQELTDEQLESVAGGAGPWKDVESCRGDNCTTKANCKDYTCYAVTCPSFGDCGEHYAYTDIGYGCGSWKG